MEKIPSLEANSRSVGQEISESPLPCSQELVSGNYLGAVDSNSHIISHFRKNRFKFLLPSRTKCQVVVSVCNFQLNLSSLSYIQHVTYAAPYPP